MSWLSPSRIPAWLAPVCEERSGSQPISRWLPLLHPARHDRRRAVADRAPEDRQREAVDLEVDDARGVRAMRAARPPRDAPGHAVGVRRVVVDPRDHPRGGADRRGDERHEQRRAEAVDVEPIGLDVGGHEQHGRVGGQHGEEPQPHRERQPECGQQRRHERVEQRDERRHHHRAADTAHLGSRDDAGREQQRERGDRPRGEQPHGMHARGLGPPRDRWRRCGCRGHATVSADRRAGTAGTRGTRRSCGAQDAGLLHRELVVGEDALLLELRELLELLDRVDRGRGGDGRGGGRRRLLRGASSSYWRCQRSPWRRETRLLTAVAVPATTAVRAIPRSSPGMVWVPFSARPRWRPATPAGPGSGYVRWRRARRRSAGGRWRSGPPSDSPRRARPRSCRG